MLLQRREEICNDLQWLTPLNMLQNSINSCSSLPSPLSTTGLFETPNDKVNELKRNLEQGINLFREAETRITEDHKCWRTFNTSIQRARPDNNPTRDAAERTLIDNHIHAINVWRNNQSTRNYKSMQQHKMARENYSKTKQDRTKLQHLNKPEN